MVIVVAVLICIQFSSLVIKFMSSEANVEYKISDVRLLEFPAVTVCNANSIKKSALEALAATNVLLQQLLSLDDSEGTKKTRRRKRSKVLIFKK